MKIQKNSKLPEWFTLAPEENGTFLAMDDPMIKEMLMVFAERLPKFNQEFLTEFNQREVETLIHGDFHCGNHRFGVDQNEGQVVVYDFQQCGFGLVSNDVAELLQCTEMKNYGEITVAIKGRCLFHLCLQVSRVSIG